MQITRLAPSPTGALHLGNARTFLINWLLARQNNWRIILRIEDLDGPRIKRGADAQAIEDLHWLGIDWDEGPIYQSSRTHLYKSAIDQLLKKKLAYPCICTRREAALAASAPHEEDAIAIYPGTCRDKFASVEEAKKLSGREPAIRFRVPESDKELGDFVIAKADGTTAYQLAVVVDDADMNITQVVRGDDLLDSTPRQVLLYRALGMAEKIPQYTHVPLVVGPDGKRLAKRHGDTRLSHYRESGVSPGRIRALLAKWCGIESDAEISIEELLQQFKIERLPRERIIMTDEDDAWLQNERRK
ncbi:MAG TPA: glutamyl-Q tRNA(Asp) synthetase [Tepidisphaeraceae bacterium]|nr:glutamyl-Q tRNA(Asp) synthetase [Tepidisphaeraceae bacterium]